MPRYFLNVRAHDGITPDPEGQEFADLDAAVCEARAAARDLIIDTLKSDEEVDGRTIEIATADGKVLDSIRLRDMLIRHT